MSAHAKLSPSTAHRWLTCTAAPSAEAGFPDIGSVYAAEGTLAHSVAEAYAREALGMTPPAVHAQPADAEMEEAARFYANYIKEVFLGLKGKDPEVYLEYLLTMDRYIPEGFGTADCLIVAEDEMHVIDFKYGKGVEVRAEGNKQMMIYALGALEWADMLYNIATVKMTIIQPRLGGVSSCEMSADELIEWGELVLRPAAEEAYSGKGTFRPSEEACRFCKAAGFCKAQADYFLGLFDENEDADLLPLEETAEILKKAKGMTAWLQSLEDRIYNALMEGTEVPGWKLVAGKSNRKYTDEAKIAKILKQKRYKAADLYEKKLIGITKMEKLLGKKKMDELIGEFIVKPEGRPALAPASDKRPEIHPEEEIKKAFDE